MLEPEIELILNDMYFHTKEILKYLRKSKRDEYDFYMDDLISYALSTLEDVKTIKNYMHNLEINLYFKENDGDVFGK